MDPIWQRLPDELVYKICNMLTKLRRIDCGLRREICTQEYVLDKIWYNNLSLFGFLSSWDITYHDMYTYIVHNEIPIRRYVEDEDECSTEQLCKSIWGLLKPEERTDMLAWAIG
jgi:hypothetical protein